MAGPLDGIRIIDLTQVLSGPYGTLQLSEQGADVIKVEPADGDGMRNSGMYNHLGLCAVGATANRGKRSISLDLTTEAGVDIVRELCADADVFVQNFRPGVVERLGLDPAGLRAANPRLITASISGYGTDGLDVPPDRKVRLLSHNLLLEYEDGPARVVRPHPLLRPLLAATAATRMR